MMLGVVGNTPINSNGNGPTPLDATLYLCKCTREILPAFFVVAAKPVTMLRRNL